MLVQKISYYITVAKRILRRLAAAATKLLIILCYYFITIALVVILDIAWHKYYHLKFESIDIGTSEFDVMEKLGEPYGFHKNETPHDREVLRDMNNANTIRVYGLWSPNIMTNIIYIIGFDDLGRVVDKEAIPQ